MSILIQAALTEANELAALEREAMSFFLEEKEREKDELKRALRVPENRGRPFHEVRHLHVHTRIGWPCITNMYTYSRQLTIELVQVRERQKRRKVSQIKNTCLQHWNHV